MPSVPSGSTLVQHRAVRRVCVAAAIVAAGSAAVSIQASAAAVAVLDDPAAAPEPRRVAVTPDDRVAPASQPEPIDEPSTTSTARYELLASTPAEPATTLEPRSAAEFGAPATDGPADEAPDGPADEAPGGPADEPTDAPVDEGADEPTEEPQETAGSDEGDDGSSAAEEPEAAASAAASNVALETWEAVARCESGYGGEPDWSINTGNGYYGGLQFSLSSWEWVGGTGYPNEASKATQIEMAERLWERQGWSAWPACSSKLGLR